MAEADALGRQKIFYKKADYFLQIKNMSYVCGIKHINHDLHKIAPL